MTKLPESNNGERVNADERRAFLRKAAIVGLPVVIATVRPRTAWAKDNSTASAAGSANPSGDNLQKHDRWPGGR
jgi:hypothetical protein